MASDLGIDGLVSGIDTTSLITKLMALEKKPLDAATQKKTDLQTEDNAWRDFNTQLYSMQTAAATLKSTTTFKGRQATLGQDDYFTATATSNAAAGTYQVEVGKLAQANVVSSGSINNGNTSLGYTGKFQLNGKDIAVNTTDTLSSIADKINTTTNIGISAAVVKMGTNSYQMTLTANTTGADNAIKATDNNNVLKSLGVLGTDDATFANVIQDAQDAKVKINGLEVTRSTNSINDIVNGVTLNLKKEGATSMTVANDTSSVVTAVKTFVDQYNKTMDLINTDLSYNSTTKVKGPLYGQSSLIYLQSNLRDYMSKVVPGVDSAVNQLSLVGISSGAVGQSIDSSKAGVMVLDETKLQSALDNHYSEVGKLFGASVSNVASSANGATVTAVGDASQQYSDKYPVTSLIDGRTDSADWGNGGGWMNKTAGSFPNSVEINFSGAKTVDAINLYTLDTADNPASQYGVRNVSLQYWDATSSSWKSMKSTDDTTKDLEITNNTRSIITANFQPVNTSKIKVTVNSANGANDYSRLTEVEAFQQNDGIFSTMYNSLWDMTRFGGTISSVRDSISQESTDNDKRITDLNTQMTAKEAAYRAKFSAMEVALSKLKTQSNQLANQLGTMTGTSSSSSG